jgi:Leucine-rich repeat (LRR) protein
MNPQIGEITFKNQAIKALPDMSAFQHLKMLYLNSVGLESIHESLFKLPRLEFIMIPNNKITTLPLGICYLKKLIAINLAGNKIKELPDEIGNLDRKNGGSLVRLVLDADISPDILEKARRLLPTTDVVEFEKTTKR